MVDFFFKNYVVALLTSDIISYETSIFNLFTIPIVNNEGQISGNETFYFAVFIIVGFRKTLSGFLNVHLSVRHFMAQSKLIKKRLITINFTKLRSKFIRNFVFFIENISIYQKNNFFS